jgi:nitrite reductase/ring-hydroxylating ferredoxin subunit
MGFRSFIKRKVDQRIRGETSAATSTPATAPLPTAPSPDGFWAVARAAEIAAGTGRTVVVGTEAVAVFRGASGWFAIDDACTHEDAPLGEGSVEGDVVVCPYHDWRYDLNTGACHTDPARPVGCFAIRVVDDVVWVGPRTSEGTAERGGGHNDGLKTTDSPR